MSNVVIATNEADSAAIDAIEQHHAELAGALSSRVEAVVVAASRRDDREVSAAADDLLRWAEQELLPHAVAEEKALYPAAHATTEGRLLITAMLEEHRVLTALLTELATASDPVRAAGTATALLAIFQSHLAKENELILPLLASSMQVSLAELLQGMHHALTTTAAPDHPKAEREHGGGGHQCDCGEEGEEGFPELDVRLVPHAIRHATVLGALDAIRPRQGMILVAHHDPLPLLAQIEQRSPGMFTLEYLERGPEAWRIQFVRQSS